MKAGETYQHKYVQRAFMIKLLKSLPNDKWKVEIVSMCSPKDTAWRLLDCFNKDEDGLKYHAAALCDGFMRGEYIYNYFEKIS